MPQYASVAGETADWVMRDMQDARGGFYSTLDADSEHEEGKFYVWTPGQFDALLGRRQRAREARLRSDGPPNFEGQHWHLQISPRRPWRPPRPRSASSLRSQRQRIDARARKLLAAREQRVWPGRDEKMLVSWNGLMVGGSRVPRACSAGPELAEAATRAVDLIRAELWRDGRLRATYKDGRARFAAYLDDYAFLAHGLLELLQSRWRSSDLSFARRARRGAARALRGRARRILLHGRRSRAADHKPKPFADEAVPAGNGVAAAVLLTLGHLLGEQRYLDAAERTVRAALHGMERYPEGHATLLRAPRGAPDAAEARRGARHRSRARAMASELAPQLPAASARVRIPNDAVLPGLLAAARAAGAGTSPTSATGCMPRPDRARGRIAL